VGGHSKLKGPYTVVARKPVEELPLEKNMRKWYYYNGP
jgi:hypothetical protein